MTKSRASKVWEAFCGELTQEPTDDMREALSTAILKIMEEYEVFVEDDGYGLMVVTSQDLWNISNDLENL